MITSSDIAKMLEDIPDWKTLASLPKRVAELEAQVAALEAGKAAQAGRDESDCPSCRAKGTVTAEKPEGHFAAFYKHQRMRCNNCGYTTQK